MVRAQLGAGTSEEESRAHLQARLTTLYKVMFWANAALLAFLKLMYSTLPPGVEPKHDIWVFAMATVAIGLMAFVWRVLLVGAPRSFRTLNGIDHFFTFGSGVVFGAAASIAYDFRPSAYTCLTYHCFALLTRALLVPSTGKRTALVTLGSYVPMTGTAVLLAFVLPVHQEVSGSSYVAGFVVVAAVTTILATAGSSIIYGLRREVDAAVRLGRYRAARLIGKGGLGEVYLAHHVMLRRPTAIKVLRPDRLGPDDLARFTREVHATSQLTHPNTVAVFDYGPTADGESFYYAMEYLGGGLNLEQLVQRDGPLPAARVVAIVLQVCGALQEAHEIGLVHRDVTPSNIMLCERGGMPDVVKVLDFGLVQGFRAEIGQSQQITYGTPHYMAPEAITEARIGPTGDLYALGCVAYYLLTGKPVFDGKTQLDILMKHASDPPVPPSRIVPVPAELEAAILRCLAKQPEARFASADALSASLGELRYADWSEERARAWWREYASSDDTAASSLSDVITVDVEHREELAS